MTTCVCKDCGKQRTRHPLGLCVLCFLRRFAIKPSRNDRWDWDEREAA